MFKIACLCLAIAAATPLWSQVEPSATGGDFSLDDSRMMTPPPVSGDAYPVIVGSEVRSNYLGAGMVVSAAYVDNLMGVDATNPVSDGVYSFVPTIGLDRRTPRQGETLNYSAGFSLYQNTSQFNSVTQNASGSYRFHISPYAVIVLGDNLRQNNDLYNQSNPFIGSGVSGTGQPDGAVIAPFQNQLANSSSAGINYQYGRNAMIGGSGSYSFQNFSESSEVSGLNDENTTGANGFYSRRVAQSNYVGVTYQFSKFVTHPVGTYTLTHTLFGFYTRYLTRSFSLSILGGPEHYTTWSTDVPGQGAWTPAVQGSFGWQSLRSNLAVTYSYVVSGAGGLIGTYHSSMAGLTGRYMLSRTWSVGGNVNYALFNNVNPTVSYEGGGESVVGGVYVEHRISERLNAQAGYAHFYQSYPGIATASTFPNSNRVNVSVNYQLHRPLGQ